MVAQTRSGTGAQVVFHYPPDPLDDDEGHLHDFDLTALDEDSSSESGSESSSDDNVFDAIGPKLGDRSSTTQVEENVDDYENKLSKVQSSEKWKPSWEPLLGIGEEGLVSLLAPGRSWHKRKFELGINDLVFVGRPVYARESGSWGKRRRKARPNHNGEDEQGSATDEDDQAAKEPSTGDDANERQDPKSNLTMFHVVFIMNPSPLEHAQRVKDMYDNVVRKISKVLKWEQAKNDYVWEQCDLIQSVKTDHFSKRSHTSDMYSDMLKKSTLATAITTIYRSIATSRIAAITLSSPITISLQIPPTTSTSYLPSLTEPPIQPGLWLTTANESPMTTSDLDVDNTSTTSTLQLAKSYSLLLRDHPQKLLKDISTTTSDALTTPLMDFISALRPSKSFYKLSQRTHLPLADIELLSQHLIYWRRAIAIPPLHHRDTYIVSPNADLSHLSTASKLFEQSFPMLPSLPRILSLLSGPPIPFGTLIPSADHKDEYYRVLAWLLRGGWVTQLRTFAYIRVSPTVKRAVREREKQEKDDAKKHNLGRLHLPPQPVNPSTNNPTTETPTLSTSTTSSSTHPPSPPAAAAGVVPPRFRPRLPSRPPSSSTTTTTNNAPPNRPHEPHHNPSHASLILSPLRASALETKWLGYIHDSLLVNQENHEQDNEGGGETMMWQQGLSAGDKEELGRAWPKMVKYFNGQEAVEKMAVREGWKRGLVGELLKGVGVDGGGGGGGMNGVRKGEGGRGLVVSFRHW